MVKKLINGDKIESRLQKQMNRKAKARGGVECKF